MKNKVVSINLLKKDRSDFFEKFINWALTVGRFIVILTEGIALSAFLYRFTLDREVIDLHDEISKKQQIIKFMKPNEDKYKSIQARLAFASTIENSAQSMTDTLKEIIDTAPSNFVISNLYLSENSIRIEAKAKSLYSLTDFINRLKNNPKVSSISLDKIENKTSASMVIVSISIAINSQK